MAEKPLCAKKLLSQVERAVKNMIEHSIIASENKLQSHESLISSMECTLESLNSSIKSEQEAISSLKSKLASKSLIVPKSPQITPQDTPQVTPKEISNTNHSLLLASYHLYASRLGLTIRKITPYSIEFSFLHITPEPQEHRLVLYLDSNGIYTARECIPPLYLTDLLENLNTHNDISTFVLSIRKAFKSLYLPI